MTSLNDLPDNRKAYFAALGMTLKAIQVVKLILSLIASRDQIGLLVIDSG